MRRSPGEEITGASRLGSCVEGDYLHASIVLRCRGHAMGIQGTTARIPARCDIGATPDSRTLLSPLLRVSASFRIETRPSSRCYGDEAGSLPFKRHAHRPLEERPSPPRSPGPYTGASTSSEKAATVGTPSRL